MWVKSAPGEGSTFHFTIRAQPAANLVAGLPPFDLQGKRVLIVDDNHTNCLILREQLRRWGIGSAAVESAAAALALLNAGGEFDLAILDLCMPQMDGLQLAEALREREQTARLPLVMLTSASDRFLREDAARLGLAAYVNKPVKKTHLHQILLQALQPHPTPTAAPEVQPIFDAGFAARLPLRMLLAEDNVVNQKVALRILGRLGYHVDVAANGQEAVEALERQPYDIILMDVQMPEVDGLEATRIIRQTLPPERQPIIIAMTAAATHEDRLACIKAGMNAFVAKPIRVEQLTACLQNSAQLL
jgi:CheY-like chemotaxis protein